MAGSAGNLVQAVDYYPFGQERLCGGPGGASCDAEKKYIGEYYDVDTALNYLNARYYDSFIGRFISQDPAFLDIGATNFEQNYQRTLQQHLMNPQALNSYSYANNNPVTWSDPGGRIAPLLLAAAVWGLAEIGLSVYDAYNAYETINDPNATELEKELSVGGFIAGLYGPAGGYGTIGKGAVKFISKNSDSIIRITKERLGHVIKNHAWNSSVPGKSTFLKGIDPVKLANEASEVIGTVQKKTGNIQRIVTKTYNVGIDKVTNQITNTYTVITKALKNGKEELITIFPGLPKP